MIKKLIASFLCIFALLGMIPPAAASDNIQAKRSEIIITVNGARIPFRAYDVNGRTCVDLFEVALALSGSENQFALGWIEKNKSLHLIRGMPYAAIGLNLTRGIARNETATPADISVLLDGDRISIAAYKIKSDVYFDLRGVAGALDFSVEWRPLDNLIGIDTSLSFTESAVVRSVDPDRPMVAITFDDGPSNFTPAVLDILEQYGVVATFYVAGSRVANNSDIVLRAFNAGNEIASHAWSHRMLTRLSEGSIRTELENTNNVVESVTGVPPSNMRPPYGSINGRVRKVTAELGLPIIYWSIDPADWRTRNADTTYSRVMDSIKDRDIVLLHDLSAPTVEAVSRIIPELIDRGYQLVTVSELLEHSGAAPVPGATYRSGAM